MYTFQIRPCDIYKSEYSECTSISSRLHQMFVYGSTLDCNSFHEDYLLCLRWKKEKDIKSAVIYFNTTLMCSIVVVLSLKNGFVFQETLVKNEKNKRNNRWKSFYSNNVWETRKTPPENWNDPLPDYIAQRKPNSTFKDTLVDYSNETHSTSLCSIM